GIGRPLDAELAEGDFGQAAVRGRGGEEGVADAGRVGGGPRETPNPGADLTLLAGDLADLVLGHALAGDRPGPHLAGAGVVDVLTGGGAAGDLGPRRGLDLGPGLDGRRLCVGRCGGERGA